MRSSYLFLILILLLPRTIHGKKPSVDGKHQAQSAQMDPMETEALFEVMESMSSDAVWRKKHPHPCVQGTWPGLQCKLGKDRYMHVSRLDFGYKPNPSCKKNAIFPSSIFKLTNLEEIFIFQCFMHMNTIIPPVGFEKLASSLHQISLRANKGLTGPIPRGFGSLGRLEVLTLSQNRLYGDIPPELGKLNGLLHLDLSYNIFSGQIPKAIEGLRNLKGLDFSYNNLRGPIPQVIGSLRMLQKLDLSSNSLSGHIPMSMGGLENLEFIALSNNKLTGMFPSSLVYLQSLQYFIMDNNPMFSPLSSLFGKLKKLQELRLANSGYSGPIPMTYGKLVNLSTLSLENNRISGIIPPILGNLSHIYHLNLTGNLLSGPVPFPAQFLHRLGNNIDLKGNVGLCINASYGMQRFEYLGVGICGALPLKANSSKKSQGASLAEMHWRIYLHIIGAWILYTFMA